MPPPDDKPATLAPAFIAMAEEAVRAQAHLDTGWLVARAHAARAAARKPGDHPLARVLQESVAPARQLLTRFEFSLNCELALTRDREASILIRPLGLGYLASASETTAAACRLTLVVSQTQAR